MQGLIFQTMAKAGRPTNEEPSIQKHVRISANMYQAASERAKELGFKFPEYVRHLIANDLNKPRQ